MQEKNIYTNGSYLQNNPSWGGEDSTWKAEAIWNLLQRNKINPTDITEVGCGAGGVLRSLSARFGERVSCYGYDISPQAITLAKSYSNENISLFNEDFTAKNIHTDLLLVIDVVEHLQDYFQFLENIKKKSSQFVFHIPLDLSCRTILKPHVLLQQRNAVGHIHYFTKEMVLWFLKDCGYEVLDILYTKPVIDIEASHDIKTAMKKMLRNFSYSFSKDLSAKLWGNYSLLILAK
ncbi:MAG: methyltransferase domain-containing protein [Ginsengibacter sp.]